MFSVAAAPCYFPTTLYIRTPILLASSLFLEHYCFLYTFHLSGCFFSQSPLWLFSSHPLGGTAQRLLAVHHTHKDIYLVHWAFGRMLTEQQLGPRAIYWGCQLPCPPPPAA